MSNTCKEWFADIGYKSTLDKEQYTHLVWCAALASIVTENNNIKNAIAELDQAWEKSIFILGIQIPPMLSSAILKVIKQQQV
jgi:hypothetical protein